MSSNDRFKDSNVVDDQGHLLVVYHGTRWQFQTFVTSKPRGAFGNPVGVYFTDDLSEAEEFAQDVDGAIDEKSRIISAHLLIRDDSDGQIRKRKDGTTEYVVFKPELIHIISHNLIDAPTLAHREDARA